MTIASGRVFVGRARERATFDRALDDAAAGSPRIVLVGGEPGIGKTALCREVAREASGRGMRVLSGQCYEQGALRLPYLPFVEAIDAYAENGWPHGEWADAALLARIVPGLRRRGLEAPPAAEGESPYPLFEAVAQFLRLAGAEQPTLLLLEDLHDADEGTLDLLAHLGRRLGGARVLMVGTYRDTEVDPSHPLSATLAALMRTELFERVSLRGLATDEVGELYEQVTGAAAGPGVAEALHAQTEGNPLFATETLRHLESEGLLSARSEAILRAVPEGLRDVIGRRLRTLSEPCRNSLTLAAVVGREFRLDVMERLCGDAAPTLGEAQDARVIEEDGGTGAARAYRFSHSLFRRYLYESVPGARRDAIHIEVAGALESVHAATLDDHGESIAEHLVHSSDSTDLKRASLLSEAAARRAFSVYAYAEAARLARSALDAVERGDPADRERRSELLLLLADALTHSAQPRAALDGPLPEAFALAEALGDGTRATHAGMSARHALRVEQMGFAWQTGEADLWARRLDRHAPAGTRERVFADVFLAQVNYWHRRNRPADTPLQRACRLAWEVGDADACWNAGTARIWQERGPGGEEDRKATTEALLALPRDGVPAGTLENGLPMLAKVLLEFGDRARAEQVKDEVVALAQRTGAGSTRKQLLLVEYELAVIGGRLEAALARLVESEDEAADAALPGNQVAVGGYRAMSYLGRSPEPEVLEALPLLFFRAAYRAVAGDRQAMRDFLAQWQYPGAPAGTQVSLLEAAVVAENRELAAALVGFLDGTLQVVNSLTLVNRVVGEAKIMLGHPVEGRSLLERGLEQAQTMRFRPEVALTHVSLAVLLLDRYPAERDEARAHLERALPELREMGMRPGLERAEALWAEMEKDTPTGVHRKRPAGGLTDREAEVLRLVAAGNTNREIAQQLVLSLRTVERHIANIYAKIDARGKADATAFALRNDLA